MSQADGSEESLQRNPLPWRKWVATYAVAALIGLYSVLVAKQYWNWLAVPVLHFHRITFLQTICIMIIVGLFTRSGFPFKFTTGDVGYLKSVEFALSLCIPAEKADDWKEFCNDHSRLLFEGFGTIAGAIGMNTLLLAIGFLLHLMVAS